MFPKIFLSRCVDKLVCVSTGSTISLYHSVPKHCTIWPFGPGLSACDNITVPFGTKAPSDLVAQA